GAGLVVLTFLDALWTTLWVDGSAGPISARITTWSWRGTLALFGRRRHRVQSLFGPFVLSLIVLLWVTMLWLGWTLIYGGEPLSLLHATTKTPADWSGRFYFVGYMLFTAGNGDYTPNGDVWQVLAALTNMTGMLLATLAITYVLSVVSAVVQKRAFASQVSGLGQTAAKIVASGWNGQHLRSLDLPLSSLSSQLSQMSERYRAYPVLQYYHAAERQKSPIVAVTLLDDALTLMKFGVPAEHQPSPAVLQSARASVESFLDTLPSAFIHPAPEAPPDPDLAAVADVGIPTLPQEQFVEEVEALSERRRRMLGLLRNDGWNWDSPS
ncbi:ion channel, partial [Palleronia sp.]|uniref:ion channel n=1 Tax=Palleronia sp. TaxID=1940284 RepID=UPI0035C7F125